MKRNSIKILNQEITVDKIREVIMKASKVNWGTHLVRWRYDDVEHHSVKYKKGSLIPTDIIERLHHGFNGIFTRMIQGSLLYMTRRQT